MDQISFYSAEASGPELADLAGVLCGQGQIVRLAKAWRAGDGKELPTGFRLTGGALRLWALAAGQPNGNHYLLAVDEDTPATHPVLAETCRQLGLPAQFVGPRAGGPAVRVTGKRRLATLEELIGTPPPAAVSVWPQVRPVTAA